MLENNGSNSSYQLIYNGREELQTYHNNVIRKNVKDILEELMREMFIKNEQIKGSRPQ